MPWVYALPRVILYSRTLRLKTTAFCPLSANRFGRVNGRFSCIITGEAPDKVKRQMSSQLEFLHNSYLFGGNAPYVEELYEAYLDNPGSVPDNWRNYFDQLQHMPAGDGQAAGTGEGPGADG